MIRPYETAVVFDGTLSDDAITKQQEALENFFRVRSELEKIDVWGKRQLAYTIEKKNLGHYVFFYYKAEGDVPAEFEKHIKLNDTVLRHLTVVRDLKNDAAREAFATRKEEIKVNVKEDDEDDVDVEDLARKREQEGETVSE